MFTGQELVYVLLIPAAVAAAFAALAWWRRWAWPMPAAVGAGFLAGYALLGVPELPPIDGNDWLFWLAAPVTLLGVTDAATGQPKWGWLLGAAAGAVALVVLWPLAQAGSVSQTTLVATAGSLAVVGALLGLAVTYAEPRVGQWAVAGVMWVTLGGAAVVVMSSNVRVVGLYGLAAATAVGPVAVVCVGRHARQWRVGRSVAIVALALLAGLLVVGRFYPDPGMSWTYFAVLLAAPALVLLGAVTPGKKKWVRGVVAVAVVAVAVAAVTVPAALAAKEAAEGDPAGADLYRALKMDPQYRQNLERICAEIRRRQPGD